MITSLNVNNFLGQKEWNELIGNIEEKERIWEKNREYLFSYIKSHINRDDDLVILHEVPYVYETRYNYRGQLKYKRSNVRCQIYLQLLEFCKSKKLSILYPETVEVSYFRTIAICYDKKYSNINLGVVFEEYKNRILVLKNNVTEIKQAVVGVHAPSTGNIDNYWKSLKELHSHLELQGYRNKIFIGDFNVYLPGTCQKKLFFGLLSEGLVDMWIEKGNSHKDATFEKGTRIDYALVSDGIYNELEIYKDDDIRKDRYSDHSAVIISNS